MAVQGVSCISQGLPWRKHIVANVGKIQGLLTSEDTLPPYGANRLIFSYVYRRTPPVVRALTREKPFMHVTPFVQARYYIDLQVTPPHVRAVYSRVPSLACSPAIFLFRCRSSGPLNQGRCQDLV